jgi:molybdate transport system substrate-binding protein
MASMVLLTECKFGEDKYDMDRRCAASGLLFALAGLAIMPSTLPAQVKVITSGGFAVAYNEMLPALEKAAGVPVTTSSGASQGQGPDTIGAQLRRGVAADVVIMSREGLQELIEEGRIVRGTAVDLAQTPIGVGVRAGAPKPDISTVDGFKRALVRAKAVAIPSSTTGIYLTSELFPRLGIAQTVVVKSTTRGAASVALVAAGEAELAIQPVSEILHAPGVDFVGPIPPEIQYISVFTAAVVAGSKQPEAAKRLIGYLASESAATAIQKSGMEPAKRR